MARFSFGGAQDLSSIFADLYRIGEQAAARERGAEDENVINQWETGEISDEEFYAYAQQRINESDDPEERSQWEVILRNAQQQNEGEAIQDTAEDIMDGIEAGTRSWDDLLAFYQNKLRSLRPSDPLYREVSAEINKVQDTIRDNEVSRTMGSIEYRFRSGQISGAQAGKELRALAERYKSNDPNRYYQLLGAALDMETGNGGGSGGSGGGSRSGGSGSGGSGLKDTINQLEGFESRLLALSKQARDGQRVGEITVPDGEGGLTTERIRLLNADGSVTNDLRAVHQQTLALYDELERAHLADGNSDAAGEDAERRSAYILDYVQPANTISRERQWDRLVDDLIGTVQRADSNPSPALAWRDIIQQANKMGGWFARLNTRTTSTDVTKRASDAEVRDNPELSAAARRSTTTEESDLTRRLTPTFTDEVAQQMQALMAALQSEDPAAIMSAFEGLPEGSKLAEIAPALSQIRVVQQGLADGSWQYAVHPEFGVIPVEVIREQTGLDAEGNPIIRAIPQMFDSSGAALFNPDQGDEVTTVVARVGNEYQPVIGIAQQQVVATSNFTWNGVTYSRGQAIPDDVQKEINSAIEKGQSAPLPIGQMRVSQMPGGETFYGIDMPDGSIGWYRNRLPRRLETPSVPAPYTGPAENAQRAFTRLGLDTTGRRVLDSAVATGNRVSMRAFDQFAGPQANIQRATADVGYQQPTAPRVFDPGAKIGQDVPGRLPGMAGPGTEPIRALSYAQTLAAVRGDTEPDPLANLRRFGQSLGINGLHRAERGGMLAQRRTFNIDRPNITPVNVSRPNVNVDVAGLKNLRSRLQSMAAGIRSRNASRFAGTSLGRSGRATTPNVGRRLEAI